MVALSGCTGNDRSDDRSIRSSDAADRVAASPNGSEATDLAAVTVAGCLEQRPGGSFVLTRVNEPPRSVGTSGSETSAAPRAAARAYRIDPADDMKLEPLVGSEVKVAGNIDVDARMPRAANERRAANIGQGDLTRIHAYSVSALRDVCQGAEPGAAGRVPAASGAERRR